MRGSMALALAVSALAATGCANRTVLRVSRGIAAAAIACDASQTVHVAARGWPNGTWESGNAGMVIGEHPGPGAVGGYMAAYLVGVLAASEVLPERWRPVALGAVAAWHMTAVVPNQGFAGGLCGIGG